MIKRIEVLPGTKLLYKIFSCWTNNGLASQKTHKTMYCGMHNHKHTMTGIQQCDRLGILVASGVNHKPKIMRKNNNSF